MSATREQKKQEAIKYLKAMKLDQEYIDGFTEDDTIYIFRNYLGFDVEKDNKPTLLEKIKELEENHKCLVYAITDEQTAFGHCYSLLIITNYKSEWKTLLESGEDLAISENILGEKVLNFAYVWNETYEDCSEFGTVGINSLIGGITRIA